MNKPPSDFGGLCFLADDQISDNLMSRVVIVGAKGAGKTCAAMALAAKHDLQLFHKDAFALTRKWEQRSRDEVQAALVQAVTNDRWVLEGGPSILSSAVLSRATLVIWLDLPAGLRTWRVFRRSIRYLGRTRPEHPPENRDWPSLRQMRFLWRAFTDGPAFSVVIKARLHHADMPILRLSRKADIARLLA